jgi:hypothetical protein
MKVYIVLISSSSSISIINVYDAINKAEIEKQELLSTGKFTDSEINILEYDLK